MRENDGVAMVETWKIDIPQFWQKHHNKYMIIGHKFLSGTDNNKFESFKCLLATTLNETYNRPPYIFEAGSENNNMLVKSNKLSIHLGVISFQ